MWKILRSTLTAAFVPLTVLAFMIYDGNRQHQAHLQWMKITEAENQVMQKEIDQLRKEGRLPRLGGSGTTRTDNYLRQEDSYVDYGISPALTMMMLSP